MSGVKVTVEGLEVTYNVAVFAAPKTAQEFRAVVEASGITEWRTVGGSGAYPADSVVGELEDRIHLHLSAPPELRRPISASPAAVPFIAEFLAEVQS